MTDSDWGHHKWQIMSIDTNRKSPLCFCIMDNIGFKSMYVIKGRLIWTLAQRTGSLHKEQATYMTLLSEKQYFRGQSQQMACSFEVFLLKGENNEMIRSAFIRDANYISLKRRQPTEKWTWDKDDQAYSVPPWGIYQWIGDNLGLHIQLT